MLWRVTYFKQLSALLFLFVGIVVTTFLWTGHFTFEHKKVQRRTIRYQIVMWQKGHKIRISFKTSLKNICNIRSFIPNKTYSNTLRMSSFFPHFKIIMQRMQVIHFLHFTYIPKTKHILDINGIKIEMYLPCPSFWLFYGAIKTIFRYKSI